MLTKVLFTVLVIIGVVLFLRHKKTLDNPPVRTITIQPEEPASQTTAKWVALGVLTLTLLTGSIMLYVDWADDRRIYSIKIVNPQTSKVDHYKAYKKDLRGRTFTTITGQQITVSDLERLEFEEIE